MKTYIRYLAIINGKDPLKDKVLITEKTPPDTPYYKLEIRVSEHEKLFSHERPEGGKGK